MIGMHESKGGLQGIIGLDCIARKVPVKASGIPGDYNGCEK